jgi:hypothetical protein
MTEPALAQGMALLFAQWPHRADSSDAAAALTMIYRETLGDLSDAAWLAGCWAALATSTHFPMPVELRDLAEASADAVYHERVTATEQQRIGAAHADIRRLLTAGTVTEEQAEQTRTRYDRMVSDTLLAIREAGERTRRDRRHEWLHERHASRNRRIADGHWESPPTTPND